MYQIQVSKWNKAGRLVSQTIWAAFRDAPVNYPTRALAQVSADAFNFAAAGRRDPQNKRNRAEVVSAQA